MSKVRSDQEGGTRAVLGGSRSKLDAITGKGRAAESEALPGAMAAETRPQRVRKTISISVETVLAIKKIQEQRLITNGKQPTDSALIDEAVMELLRMNKLSL